MYYKKRSALSRGHRPANLYTIHDAIRRTSVGVTLCALVLLSLLSGCTQRPPAATTAPPQANTASSQPTPELAAPKFVDVTDRAGIRFQHQNSNTPRKYLIEIMGSGGAFIDYDGDGWQDILLLNNRKIPGGQVSGRPTMKLYHNNHDGTFTDVTKQAGLESDLYAMGVAVGDYDNDGRDDLYVTTALDGGRLYHNEGGGRFRDVTAQAGVRNPGKWGTSCAWVDYDRDGKLDLFVCNYVKYGSLKDDQPCYAGSMRQIVYCIPGSYETSFCTLYHNEGNGRFRDVSVESGISKGHGKSLGVTVWDADGDGWPDLFVSNDTVPGFLFHNKKDGTFEEIGIESAIAYDEEGSPHSGMGIDTGDVFNDGTINMILTNYYGQKTSFYSQSGKLLFRDNQVPSGIGPGTAKVLGFGVLFFDADNDGWLDVAQVNGHVQDDIEQREAGTPFKQPTLLFQNQRHGAFTEVGLRAGAPFDKRVVGRGVAQGDFDNDGRQDLLIMPNNGSAMLWHNETAANTHWLTLKLIGNKSNRNGIGALITLKAGGIRQRAMVRSGSSYLSQSDIRAHFGMGAETTGELEIRWPSGVVDKIATIHADRFYEIKEGTGKATEVAYSTRSLAGGN